MDTERVFICFGASIIEADLKLEKGYIKLSQRGSRI
jgi:hypothetical protein